MSKLKLNKTVLLDRKEYTTLNEFADNLELIAKRLREDDQVIFKEGDKETIISPKENVKVEYKYQVVASKHKFEIELKWDELEKPNLEIE